MKWAAAWTATTVAALLFLLPRPSAARYEHARALGTRCSTCHDGHHPDIETLNAAGRYFLVRRTLAGWKAGAAVSAGPVAPAPAVFERICSPCHGAAGEGTAKARPLWPAAKATSPSEIEGVVRKGLAGTTMFGFRDVLSAEEIRAVTGYVQTLRAR